jgi:Tol biopolymer transport system component
VSSSGRPANRHSELSDISGDGRYVLFESRASNLVPHDTNDVVDLFVRDTVKNTTRRISLASDGRQADSDSWDGALSGNGKWAVFVSLATNLVLPATEPERPQIYVHNLGTGRTVLVSRSGQGEVGNAPSLGPSLSANGQYVAFASTATNLGNRPAATPRSRIFVRDRYAAKTRLVSLNPNGGPLRRNSQLAEISADGTVVAWVAGRFDRAGPLYSTYAWDRDTGASELVSVFQSGEESYLRSRGQVAVSGDGRLILFSSRDQLDGDASEQTDPFANDADVFLFVRDREAHTTTRVAHAEVAEDPLAAPFSSMAMAITPDGRQTLFSSSADNLVANDTNRQPDLFIQHLAVPD